MILIQINKVIHKMKEFNFEVYQSWFNENYNDAGFYLDEGPYPIDGEMGIHEAGFGICVPVYPEGAEVGTQQDCIVCPACGTPPDPDFIPKLDLDKETIEEYKIDERDLKIVEKRFFDINTKALVLPFLREYLKFFEDMAIDFTGIAPLESLEDYLRKK